MAEASQDPNFKEELSAIEQCELLVLLSVFQYRFVLTLCMQGSASFLKQSALPPCTACCSIRPRCRSASSSPFSSKWPDQIP